MIAIYRTNIRSWSQLKKVAALLSAMPSSFFDWSVDRDDADCILRIESADEHVANAVVLLREAGFTCDEID